MRGKDKKKRKTENYSESSKKRWQNEDYRKRIHEASKESRRLEKQIPENIEILSIEDTKKEIQNILPWNQGTVRKVYNNKPLYASILHHTRDVVFHGKKLSEKIYYIMTGIYCTCQECNGIKTFNTYDRGYSTCNNVECSEFSPRGLAQWKTTLSEDEYKRKFSESYTIDGSPLFTKDWFMKRYPKDGKRLHSEYVEKMKQVAIKNVLSHNKSSQAADNFFSELLKYFPEGECHLTTGEKVFHTGKYEDKLNQKILMVDFHYNNKIVEYDGEYWHDAERDRKRDDFLKEMGYDVFRVYHSECKRSDGFQKSLENAIKFIEQ